MRTITNIVLDGDNDQSTLLANCVQVLVCIADDASEWLSSKNVSEETKLLFRYLCCLTIEDSAEEISVSSASSVSSIPTPTYIDHEELEASEGSITEEHQTQSIKVSEVDKKLNQLHISAQTEQQVATYQQNRLIHIKTRLRELIASGDYSNLATHTGSTLLNINDIGGQPCFLEMLPALSTGPALYLVFLDLSKELDKPYKIPFSRDNTIITPYNAIHTVEATIWQITSAIASVHCISNEKHVYTDSATFREKFEHFLKVSPVATLIGTHKDKLNHPEEKLKQINEALKKLMQNFNGFK